jgi:hypothetical protein
MMANNQTSAMIAMAIWPGLGKRTGRLTRVPPYTTPAAAATRTMARTTLARPP